MHKLLKIQLKKIYGRDFKSLPKDKKFKEFLSIIDESYKNFQEEEKFLENTLQISAEELEETNALLIRQKELLQNVENSMEDVIFYKDLNHKYIGGNKQFLAFVGLREEELIGKSDEDFFDKETAKRYHEMNEDIFKNRSKILYKQWVSYKGKKIYVLTSKTPLINRQGKVIGIVGISRDITSEYELKQKLEEKNLILIQQNKLISMGEMIANIAHQWRQPLNALSLLIQKISIFYHHGKLNKQKMDTLASEAMILMQGMSDTIDDFRNFFSTKRVLENFSVQESVSNSLMIIESMIKENDIKLNINIDKEYYIYGYKNEFFQVLLNLLINATEALIADNIINPMITLYIRSKEKENIIIEICDNANGIQERQKDKIFEPYFTTKENGTGLGLYMSKIIIEKHMQGTLHVQSNIFGTTFILSLGGGTPNLDHF